MWRGIGFGKCFRRRRSWAETFACPSLVYSFHSLSPTLREEFLNETSESVSEQSAPVYWNFGLSTDEAREAWRTGNGLSGLGERGLGAAK